MIRVIITEGLITLVHSVSWTCRRKRGEETRAVFLWQVVHCRADETHATSMPVRPIVPSPGKTQCISQL